MKNNFTKGNRTFLYQIVGIVLLCISFVALFTNFSLAWFKDESTTSNGAPNITIIGTLDVKVTTNFNFENLALAPDTIYTEDALSQDISTRLRTTNKNTIDGAYVRIKFVTTRLDVGETEVVDNQDYFDLYFDGNLTTAETTSTYDHTITNNNPNEKKWIYNPADNYYYYLGAIYSHEDVIFNAGYITSNIYTNAIAEAQVFIDFQVETIQRRFGAYTIWDTTSPNLFKTFAAGDTQAHPNST